MTKNYSKFYIFHSELVKTLAHVQNTIFAQERRSKPTTRFSVRFFIVYFNLQCRNPLVQLKLGNILRKIITLTRKIPQSIRKSIALKSSNFFFKNIRFREKKKKFFSLVATPLQETFLEVAKRKTTKSDKKKKNETREKNY